MELLFVLVIVELTLGTKILQCKGMVRLSPVGVEVWGWGYAYSSSLSQKLFPRSLFKASPPWNIFPKRGKNTPKIVIQAAKYPPKTPKDFNVVFHWWSWRRRRRRRRRRRCYLAKDSSTPRTGLLDRLPEAALAAHDLLYVVPPEGVALLLVMTEPAPVEIVAARSLKYQQSQSQPGQRTLGIG